MPKRSLAACGGPIHGMLLWVQARGPGSPARPRPTVVQQQNTVILSPEPI